jgi:hypothetical protein
VAKYLEDETESVSERPCESVVVKRREIAIIEGDPFRIERLDPGDEIEKCGFIWDSW